MRVVVLVVLLLGMISSVFAVGMYVPASGDVHVKIGDSVPFVVTIRNDDVAKQIEFYALMKEGFAVGLPGRMNLSLGTYETRDISVNIIGIANGTTMMRYGFRDVTPSTGFGVQLVNEGYVGVIVGNGVNLTGLNVSNASNTSGNGGSSGGGSSGGGGGGGYFSVYSNSSSGISSADCYSAGGKYVLQNNTWLCTGLKNVTVSSLVVKPASASPPVVQMNDVGAGEAGIVQGSANNAVNGVVAPIAAMVDSAGKIVPVVAKTWLVAIIVLSGILMASSLSVAVMLRGGENA